MALALPQAFTDRGMLYALAYWSGRIILGVDGLVAAVRSRTVPINPVTVSIAVTGPLLLTGALLEGSPRVALWGCAAMLDLATPTLLRGRLRGMHVNAGHLAERFGLFVLIALGESVVAIGGSAGALESVTLTVGLTVAAAFAVGMHGAVLHPTDRLGGSVTGLLYGGTALYLATFGFTRWAMFRLVSVTRLSAAAVVLLLLPAAA